MWRLEWGEQEAWLIEHAAEGDEDTPLADKPEIETHLLWIYNAFWALHGDRHQGMGRAGKLPFLAIDRYAERYGIDGDLFEYFHDLLTRLDAAFMAWDPPAEKTKQE